MSRTRARTTLVSVDTPYVEDPFDSLGVDLCRISALAHLMAGDENDEASILAGILVILVERADRHYRLAAKAENAEA
jgi:hypothetical protein